MIIALLSLAALICPIQANFLGRFSQKTRKSNVNFCESFFESCNIFINEKTTPDFDDYGGRVKFDYSLDKLDFEKFYCLRGNASQGLSSYKVHFQKDNDSKFTMQVAEQDLDGFIKTKNTKFLENESFEWKMADAIFQVKIDKSEDEPASITRLAFDLKPGSEAGSTSHLACYESFTCVPQGGKVRCHIEGPSGMNGRVALHLNAKSSGEVIETGVANVDTSANEVFINTEKLVSLHANGESDLDPVICGANGVCSKVSMYEIIVEHEMINIIGSELVRASITIIYKSNEDSCMLG